MILGIGVDIIEIDRIKKSVDDLGDRFLSKIFTPGEISYCNSRPNAYQHFAARFAAKEALSKAVATGWTGEFRWQDVEVTNAASGQPLITLHGTLGQKLDRCTVFVSLSHSDSHVVAMVVLEEQAQ